ncbi:MAG: hypothetical protein K2Z81_09420, partial [Cyanobacteria bacterium]|nr:hypothetical protein [Cyanobacteriota bacterium]
MSTPLHLSDPDINRTTNKGSIRMTSLMKRFGLTALAAMFFVAPSFTSRAIADDNAQLSVTQAATSVDVTVYGEGFAQVEETRSVQLSAGKNRIQLNGVAGKYRNDSLRILDVKGTGEFKYKSATYQPANIDKILELCVNDEITITVGQGATARRVTGKLISVRGGQVVLVETGTDKTILGSAYDVEINKLPKGVSATASLVIEAEVAVAGNYNLHYLYETDGLSWSAKHSLLYDEASKKVESFETTVNVINQCGTSFDNANLWVLSGSVQQNKGFGGARFRGEAYAAPAAAMAADSATVESVGERKVYRIPGKVSLIDGQSRQIPLF